MLVRNGRVSHDSVSTFTHSVSGGTRPDVHDGLLTPGPCLIRVMIDCSRNGVLKVESVKTLLRHLALMGSNMLQVRIQFHTVW